MEKINLAEKLSGFREHWRPKIVADVDDYHVKVAKLKGEFVWHHHENEDELFLVLKGRLRIRLRDGDVELEPGELVVVPKGVEHCPASDEEVHLMLFERRGTLNTGNLRNERTVEPERI
jgi:mannose-6-phosphate isomerase-like protein (cupin superfamily)